MKLADTGRVSVKLSGYAKFSQQPYPFNDCLPFVRALVDAFTLDHCLWASDWPYLRATERQDYGPLTALVAALVSGCGGAGEVVFRHGEEVVRICLSQRQSRRSHCLLLIPPPLAGEGGERSEPGGGSSQSRGDPTPGAIAPDPPLSGEG